MPSEIGLTERAPGAACRAAAPSVPLRTWLEAPRLHLGRCDMQSHWAVIKESQDIRNAECCDLHGPKLVVVCEFEFSN